jgi:hypothetical protein
VQRRVGKGRVERLAELQLRGVHQPGVEPARLRRGDHAEAVVDPDDVSAGFLDLQRKCPVTAADVEDMLARLRVEQVERRFAELGDEPADAGLIGRVPQAGRGNRLVQSDARYST